MDGIVLVNKESGITSHDLVLQARRALNEKRIGHTGTLDPLANGLMILTIGKATKVLPFLNHHSKEYICQMQFGYTTDSLDITGNITERKEFNQLSYQQLRAVCDKFIGQISQIPPMYSAKKVNGRHLYSLARENETVTRQPISIKISELEILNYQDDLLQFRVVCSTGTYVRSLVDDIAKKTGNLATMVSLTRTKIDKYDLKEANTIQMLKDNNYQLISTYDLLSYYPYYQISDPTPVYQGKRLKLDGFNQDVVMITVNKEVIAAYQLNKEDGYYYSKRGLW
ncbi:MAG: tRNA pseudouridine(55) synthase TruB [Erysipelotrichaceae bacterium]